jgi:hypothetical protein
MGELYRAPGRMMEIGHNHGQQSGPTVHDAATTGSESGVTMVEATPFADLVSQLEVRLARGGVQRLDSRSSSGT